MKENVGNTSAQGGIKSLKREIYRLFTVENGIILSSAAIACIEGTVESIGELHTVLDSVKSRIGNSSITNAISEQQILDLIQHTKGSPGDTRSYSLEAFKFGQQDLCREFEAFRNRFPHRTTPISLLSCDSQGSAITVGGDSVNNRVFDSNKNADSTIFGILYRNRRGSFSLEDDYGTVELGVGSVENDCFVFEGMFVGARGKLADNGNNSKGMGVGLVFVVKEFILVKPTIAKKQNKFLVNSKPKIVVCWGDEKLASILAVEKPEILVVFKRENKGLDEIGKGTDVIMCPSVEDSDFMPCVFPSSLENTSSDTKDKAYTFMSNPFILETFDSSIGLIDVGLFKNRQDGLFFNKNSMISFLKAVISQNSLYPFGNGSFSVPEFPNFFVVLQDFHPVVMDIEFGSETGDVHVESRANTVKVISLPMDGHYAVLDFAQGSFEIKTKQ